MTGTGSDGLSVRSGPSTSSEVIGHEVEGAEVHLVCWVHGEAVPKPGGGTYDVWSKRTDGGFMADYWISGDTRATIPQCDAPAPAPPAAGEPVAREGEQVIANARGMLGQTHQPIDTEKKWDGWCLRAVGFFHGRTTGGYNTALEAFNTWSDLMHHEGDIPRGSVVFWDTSHPYEHVGVYVGGGMAISTGANGIYEHSVHAWPIMGWVSEPPAHWSSLY